MFPSVCILGSENPLLVRVYKQHFQCFVWSYIWVLFALGALHYLFPPTLRSPKSCFPALLRPGNQDHRLMHVWRVEELWMPMWLSCGLAERTLSPNVFRYEYIYKSPSGCASMTPMEEIEHSHSIMLGWDSTSRRPLSSVSDVYLGFHKWRNQDLTKYLTEVNFSFFLLAISNTGLRCVSWLYIRDRDVR